MIAVGIDIGTNTAIMVVASVLTEGSYTIIHDVHTLPRLGEDLDRTGIIGDRAIERARDVMHRFRAVILDATRGGQACSVYAVATSAVREAANGAIVRAMLEDALGWPITTIDGRHEATLTFAGAVGSASAPVLMMDIGGGSTEYACGTAGSITYATSTLLGVVKFTERFVSHYPISSHSLGEAQNVIVQTLLGHQPHVAGADRLVATAGTPTALAMIDRGCSTFDATVLDGHVLSRNRVDELLAFLCSLPLDELRAIPGLDERRADILPMGTLILSTSLHTLGYDAVHVSTKGLRHGALLQAINQRMLVS